MESDERRHLNERRAGLAMMATIVFGIAIGGGVGIFFEQPIIGGVIGGFMGIAIGFWLVPRLLSDWS